MSGAEQVGDGEPGALQRRFVAAAKQLANEYQFRRSDAILADQLGHRTVQCLRELPQQQDGGISGPGFQVGEVPFEIRASRARTLRVTPRRERINRTRSPSTVRNGSLDRLRGSGCDQGECSLMLS